MYTVIVRFKKTTHCSSGMAVGDVEALFNFLWVLDHSDDVLEYKVIYQDARMTQKDLNWKGFKKWVTTFFETYQ
jgi:hypothetical protein